MKINNKNIEQSDCSYEYYMYDGQFVKITDNKYYNSDFNEKQKNQCGEQKEQNQTEQNSIKQMGQQSQVQNNDFIQQNIYQENYDNPKQDENGQTDAIKQAIKGKIPYKQYEHNPEIRDKYGNSVSYYLFQNNIEIPYQWQDKQYKAQQKDRYGCTEGMRQAYINKKIPDQKFYHDPNVVNNYGNTMADCLEINHLPIPNQWYDSKMKSKLKNSEFIQQAIYGIIPIKTDEINANYQNCNGFTVAMILAQNKINIPSDWNHNKYLRNKYKDTVKTIMKRNNIKVPEIWNYEDELDDYYEKYNVQSKTLISPEYNDNEDKMTYPMFLASKGIIPQIQWFHNPKLKDKNGNTVSMLLAKNGKQIPKQWYHDNLLRNNDNETVALCYAKAGYIPEKYWRHGKMLCNKQGKTVQQLLLDKNIKVPKHWKYISDSRTHSMRQAIMGQVPSKQYEHNPEVMDKYGNTVAIYLIKNNIQVPKQWLYSPEYKLSNEQTTAMKIAQLGIIPPQEWYHNPDIVDDYNHTVCFYLWEKGIQVPNKWQDKQYKNPQMYDQTKQITMAMKQAFKKQIPNKKYYHDPKITDQNGNTVEIVLLQKGISPPKCWSYNLNIQNKQDNIIKQNLHKFNFIYKDDQFMINTQTEIKKIGCIMCLSKGQKEFVKSTCNHNVCLQCYNRLTKFNQHNYCPCCKMQNWVQLNNNDVQVGKFNFKVKVDLYKQTKGNRQEQKEIDNSISID